MKLGKALYMLGVIIMIFLSVIMIKSSMYLLGGFIALISITSIINYIDIEQTNRSYNKKTTRRRRAAFFKSLPEAEKEKYFSDIEKQIK